MKELFSLGKMFPSDFLKQDEEPRCEPVELKLMLDDNGIVCLENAAPKEVLWGKYWYRSSISNTMKSQLEDIVDSVLKLFKLNRRDLWIDIAGNDGYMLSKVPPYVDKVNIDPAEDSFKKEAQRHCDLVIQDYFSAEVFKKSKFGNRKANVVSVISMFYDLTDPDTFLDDVYEIMDDNALFVLQLSYSPLMIEQVEYSNICHEHLRYYSFFNIKPLLEKNGFRVMDVSLNNTNAGSFRIYAMKEIADVTRFSSQTHRDVCAFRIKSLLSHEKTLKLDEPETWMEFYSQINILKLKTRKFIQSEISKGKIVMGYGASTKFNTVLQYLQLNNEMITAIAERNPDKYGLRTVGSNIPIISEEMMRDANPDYLLIGPAHFLSEFKERERDFLEGGGKFIVTMPKFEIISA